eukprot:6208048-Pleurochrysis_carterae.AAC.5
MQARKGEQTRAQDAVRLPDAAQQLSEPSGGAHFYGRLVIEPHARATIWCFVTDLAVASALSSWRSPTRPLLLPSLVGFCLVEPSEPCLALFSVRCRISADGLAAF